MKAYLFTTAMTVLTSAAQADDVHKHIYDEEAQELAQALDVTPVLGGDRYFSTSDGTLEISCIQGLRASCTLSGAFDDARLAIYDEAAEEVIEVLGLTADKTGAFRFETTDGSLKVHCYLGLRPSCAISVDGALRQAPY